MVFAFAVFVSLLLFLIVFSLECYTGTIIAKIRVIFVIRGAPDVFEDLLLTILSTSESYASWAESNPDLDSHGMCDMNFRLPSRTFRVGERIEGTLVITPSQDFKARSLTVELARVEVVSRESGNFSETVEASEVGDESPPTRLGDQGVLIRFRRARNCGSLSGNGSDLRRVEAQGGAEAQDGFRPRTAVVTQCLQRTEDYGRTLAPHRSQKERARRRLQYLNKET